MDWLIFGVIVIALGLIDLFGFKHSLSLKKSALISAFYIAVAVVFGGWVWHHLGAEKGIEYFTAYTLEKSLSFDNVFVISLIFTTLSIPLEHRHRILFWGILGAFVMRGIFIGVGTALVANFHWVLMLFGGFLLFTGVKMMFSGGAEDMVDIEKNLVLRWMRKYFRITLGLHGRKFFVKDRSYIQSNGIPMTKWKPVWMVTPLFVALVIIEVTDLVFAVDSIPAAFAVSQDPFIVYTSNIFAIIGLRSLFFVLEAMVHRFEYLGKALAFVLAFIGGKMLAAELLGFKIPTDLSLLVVLAMIIGGIGISLFKTRKINEPQRT